jgi:hypothetical protein
MLRSTGTTLAIMRALSITAIVSPASAALRCADRRLLSSDADFCHDLLWSDVVTLSRMTLCALLEPVANPKCAVDVHANAVSVTDEDICDQGKLQENIERDVVEIQSDANWNSQANG